MVALDCATLTTCEINDRLAALTAGETATLEQPHGRHNLAVGLQRAIDVTINGHSGYYTGGMNQSARITLSGNAGPGVGENMMSGLIRVRGHASAGAGASGHGGLLVIEQDASVRCGISLKGADIVVGGSVGNMCGFLAQAGSIVVCGDADADLGDSLYEAVIYVRGEIRSFGADAQPEDMAEPDYARVGQLLEQAGFEHDPRSFKRVASARTLYHFDASKEQAYG